MSFLPTSVLLTVMVFDSDPFFTTTSCAPTRSKSPSAAETLAENQVQLAGWWLGDAGSLSEYCRFPRNAVIDPRSYVVLFGGGHPAGFTIPVYTDDGEIGDGLTDTGEAIHLIDDYGHEVASLFHSTWPDSQSLVRIPSNGRVLIPHQTASRTAASFSPGYAPAPPIKVKPAPPVKRAPPVKSTYALFISEVLADPPAGPAGDANFLAGWWLGDTASLHEYFRFPPDAFMASGSYAVLFGGGHPAGFSVPVYTDDGKIGDGLTDTGEAIYLIDQTGHMVARVSHATWPDDQSIVRDPPDGGAFVPHQTASPTQEVFSPGRGLATPPDSAAKIPAMTSATSLQVGPNPFNATTHLHFYLRQAAFVHGAIYNVHGQLVRTLVDAPLHAGMHQMQWDGRDERGLAAATGPYFARFRIGHHPPHYAKLVLLR